MPYQLFHDLFPETAERETRTMTVLEHSSVGLPPGEYALLEMFCNERGCDCRRVFFYVVSSLRDDVEAVIAYGWASPQFYARWMKDDDPHMVAELQGPVLNVGSPQSRLAPAILGMIQHVALQDETYVERIKRHYKMFRAKIDGAAEATSPNKRMKKRKTTRKA